MIFKIYFLLAVWSILAVNCLSSPSSSPKYLKKSSLLKVEARDVEDDATEIIIDLTTEKTEQSTKTIKVQKDEEIKELRSTQWRRHPKCGPDSRLGLKEAFGLAIGFKK